jgi:hypothetical protein
MPHRPWRTRAALLACLFALLPAAAHADWPLSGLVVTADTTTKRLSSVVADGLGGVYVVARALSDPTGTGPRRVLHVTRTGDRGTGWTQAGVLLPPREYAGSVSDGAHGLYVTQIGPLLFNYNIDDKSRTLFGLRFDADHGPFPGWPDSGAVIDDEHYTLTYDLPLEDWDLRQSAPDDSGGAYLAFGRGPRGAPPGGTLRVIRLRPDGSRAGASSIDFAFDGNDTFDMTPDGQGGLIVLRERDHVGLTALLYDRTATPIRIREFALGSSPTFVEEGLITLRPGHDVLAWWRPWDQYSNHAAPDTLLRMDDSLRTVAPWPDAGGAWLHHPLLSDEAGGYFARVSVSGVDRVQRFSLSGGLPVAQWPADSLPPWYPDPMVTDGQGGYFALHLSHDIPGELLALHVGADGRTASAWPASEVQLDGPGTAGLGQALVATAPGEAIAVWMHYEASGITILAQRLADDATVPAQASLVSMDARADRVTLTWDVPGAPALTVQRRVAAGDFAPVGTTAPVGRDRVTFEDLAVSPRAALTYRLVSATGVLAGSEVQVVVPAIVALSMRALPAAHVRGEASLEFTLPDASPARLELLDVAGRLVARREVGSLGVGVHQLSLGGAQPLPAGLFFARLSCGERRIIAKVAVQR